MRKRMSHHALAQERHRRKMQVITNSPAMLDNGGCVHNAILPDLSTRTDPTSAWQPLFAIGFHAQPGGGTVLTE
jgi:hypothetical protein